MPRQRGAQGGGGVGANEAHRGGGSEAHGGVALTRGTGGGGVGANEAHWGGLTQGGGGGVGANEARGGAGGLALTRRAPSRFAPGITRRAVLAKHSCVHTHDICNKRASAKTRAAVKKACLHKFSSGTVSTKAWPLSGCARRLSVVQDVRRWGSGPAHVQHHCQHRCDRGL